VYYICKKYNAMTFDDITEDGRLWAVRYDGEDDNVLFKLFRPLENSRIADSLLGKEKARLKHVRRSSWLRIYAIKLSVGVYIVTGGAIKLTATMQEREHTLHELHKLEIVRRFLLEEGIVDNDGFIEYLSEA
jgi:hypothetical protein